jgi:hypothetical protein
MIDTAAIDSQFGVPEHLKLFRAARTETSWLSD